MRDEIRKQMDALRGKIRNEVTGDMMRVLVEILCLNRRLVGNTDVGLIKKSRDDAKSILEGMWL